MNDFADFTKLFGKLPTVDTKALLEAQARNTEALLKAAEIVSKTAQTVAQRQLELAQANLTDAAGFAKVAMSSKDVVTAMNQQIAFAKEVAEKAAAQGKEISDLAVQGGNEVFAVLRKRAEEGVAEANALASAALGKAA